MVRGESGAAHRWRPCASRFGRTELQVRGGLAAASDVVLSGLAADVPVAGADALPFAVRGCGDAHRMWIYQRPVLQRAFDAKVRRVLFAIPWPSHLPWTRRPETAGRVRNGQPVEAPQPRAQIGGQQSRRLRHGHGLRTATYRLARLSSPENLAPKTAWSATRTCGSMAGPGIMVEGISAPARAPSAGLRIADREGGRRFARRARRAHKAWVRTHRIH